MANKSSYASVVGSENFFVWIGNNMGIVLAKLIWGGENWFDVEIIDQQIFPIHYMLKMYKLAGGACEFWDKLDNTNKKLLHDYYLVH